MGNKAPEPRHASPASPTYLLPREASRPHVVEGNTTHLPHATFKRKHPVNRITELQLLQGNNQQHARSCCCHSLPYLALCSETGHTDIVRHLVMLDQRRYTELKLCTVAELAHVLQCSLLVLVSAFSDLFLVAMTAKYWFGMHLLEACSIDFKSIVCLSRPCLHSTRIAWPPAPSTMT
jgi:hypothetical protein